MVVTYQHLLSKKLAAKIHEANASHWEYATVYKYKRICQTRKESIMESHYQL